MLLLLQVVFTADHLGASAARAAGGVPIEEALGVLSLCHGEGDAVVPDPGDERTSHADALPCILCTVSHLGAAGATPAAPVVAVVAPPPMLAAPISEPGLPPPVPSPLRYGSERGPPRLSIV